MAIEPVQPMGTSLAGVGNTPRLAAVGEPQPGGQDTAPSPPTQHVENAAIREMVEDALRKMNLAPDQTVRLSFALHEGSDRMMVRVMDVETGEVVREIPPQELLDTVARIMQFVGLLLDRRA